MEQASVSKTPNNINKSIVWLDASVNSTQENVNAQQMLSTPTNYLKTYTDDKECENYIRSAPKGHRIILIVGGRSGQMIVPRIHQFMQISTIFVYCMDRRNEEWTKIYKKVKGVIEDINELVIQVLSAQEKQTSRERFEASLPITFFHTSGAREQSTTELNGQFVHSQILIDCLLRMRSNPTDKNEFLTYCKKEYAKDNPQLDIIREFEQNYSSDRAITWYTRDCFLYRLLNKALRIQNIDALYLFAFFIHDLQQQLKRNQYSSPINIYRGQLMSKKEVQQLKNAMGQLISMNSFLSTTLDRDVAIIFLGDTGTPNNDYQPVLFEIQADPHTDTSRPFADITHFSYMDDEEEVLMMLGSIFRLGHIRYEGQLCIIQLILCSENGHDVKPIFDHIRIDYHGKGYTNAGVYGIVLANMGKFDEAEKYMQRELNRPFSNIHTEKTKAYNISVHYKNLGNVASSKADYESSLNWLHKALQIRLQLVRSDDPSIAEIYHDMGTVYLAKGDNKMAMELFNKALAIYRQVFGEDDLKVANSLSRIGSIHAKEGRYSEAIRYQQKALTIRQKHLSANDRFLGESHASIAFNYRSLRNLDLALEHYNMALKIYEKSLPSQHPHVANVYNGIGTIYSDKGNYQQALSYFEKAGAILRQTLPSNHSDLLHIENNISGLRNVLHTRK